MAAEKGTPGGAWRADEYRPLRAAAVALSMAAWTAEIARPEVESAQGLPVVHLGQAAMIAGVVHLGLLMALAAERRDAGLRTLAALAALPGGVAGGVGSWVLALGLIEGRSDGIAALFPPVLLLTCLQLWRMAGLRFPRWTPLAPVPGGDENRPHAERADTI